MLTFAAAVFLLLVTPGPGVLSAAGFGAAFGFRPGLTWVTGLLIGNFLVAVAVITGLWAVIGDYPAVRAVLGTAAVLYLLYLAWRIATAGSDIAFRPAEDAPGAGAAIAMQIINPKAYVVNATFFLGFPFAGMALAAEVATKLVIFNLIWIPIHLVWLQAGVLLHRLDLSAAAQRRVNIGMALAMVAVVALSLLAAWQGEV